MKRFVLASAALMAALFIGGCTTVAPNYSASIDNVELLKKAGGFHANVGAFSALPGDGNANPISLRGNPMVSPYDNSYATYVAQAIRADLTLAGKLAPSSDVELSGMLMKNDIDTAIGTAKANVQLRLIVKKAGQVRYDQVKSVEHTWESSFVGAIAIPKAKGEYPVTIQKLLASIYSDRAFIDALQ
jgi:hypothetical protein